MIDYKGKRYEIAGMDENAEELPAGSELLLSDARGIHIPRDFAGSFWDSIIPKYRKYCNRRILKNPEHPDYWEEWQRVLDHVVLKNKTGTLYTLHQDGDLWALPLCRIED